MFFFFSLFLSFPFHSIFHSFLFQAHLKVLETPQHSNQLLQGLFYLVRISEVPDNEIFKICLEYWHMLTADLYESEVKLQMTSQPLSLNPSFSRKHQYSVIMSGCRQVMISRMAKPEEVLVVEDENGDVVREHTKDTEKLAQYKTMKECLVYLTHLNYDDTENIMLQKLALEVKLALELDNTQQWAWGNLNTLCWGIGSISGAMNEEEEKRFLVTVIKDLLGLCEEKRGNDNKVSVGERERERRDFERRREEKRRGEGRGGEEIGEASERKTDTRRRRNGICLFFLFCSHGLYFS